jgi:hypothetical protein
MYLLLASTDWKLRRKVGGVKLELENDELWCWFPLYSERGKKNDYSIKKENVGWYTTQKLYHEKT